MVRYHRNSDDDDDDGGGGGGGDGGGGDGGDGGGGDRGDGRYETVPIDLTWRCQLLPDRSQQLQLGGSLWLGSVIWSWSNHIEPLWVFHMV